MKSYLFSILLAGIAVSCILADDFCKDKKDGMYTYPSNCGRYYHCANHLTYVMNCSTGLWFAPANNTCERPGDIKPKPPCKAPAIFNSVARNQQQQTTRTPPTTQAECSNNKVGPVPHASICSKFVQCTGNGLGVVKTCPNKTNFDPDYRVCVWESVYNCNGPNFCKGKKDGNYAHTSLCSKYFSCSGGLTYTMPCPAGLYYNPAKDSCDFPRNVNCPTAPTQPPTTTQAPTTTTTTTLATPKPTNSNPLAGFCAGKKDGNYVHPGDCGKYISCVAQKIVYVRNCPAGLYYNEKTDQCDWPRNVNCPPSTTDPPPATTVPTTTTTTTVPPTTTTTTTTVPPTTTTTTTTLPPTTTTTPGPRPTTNSNPLAGFCAGKKDGNYVHPGDCGKFISCVAQKIVYIRNCPAGLYYNGKTDQCDWPRNVNCPHGPSTQRPQQTTRAHVTTTITTPAPSTNPPPTAKNPLAGFCQGRKDGNYEHPTSCTKFVQCVSQRYVYIQNCPPGLHYNKTLNQCDWPENVNCAKIAKKGIFFSVPQSIARCDKVGGAAYPGSCTKYVSCGANMVPVIKRCANGLNFHPKLKVCVRPENYPCRNGLSVNFCHDKKDGNYVDPTRCDQYISCSNTLKYVMKCPKGLWYDARQDACDNPHNVQCNAPPTNPPTTTTTTTTTTTPPPATTTIAPSFCKTNGYGNHGDPTRCDTYIACDKSGRGIRMACPAGLYYNSKDDLCDFPQNVQCNIQAKRDVNVFSCNGRVGAFKTGFSCNTYFVCDGSTHTPKLKTCPKHRNFHPQSMKCQWSYSYSCLEPDFCKNKKDGLYVNRYNCYGYYECEDGTTYPKNCPALLRFNPAQNACVPASQYVCHGSVVN